MPDELKPSPFNTEALQREIDLVVGALPPNHKKALVGYYTTDGRWKTAFIYRPGDHWDIQVFAKGQKFKDIMGGVSVVWSA